MDYTPVYDLDEALTLARERNYPNRTTEDENIRRVDAQVFGEIREHEAFLANQGERVIEKSDEIAEHANYFAETLASTVMTLDEGDSADALDLASRLKSLTPNALACAAKLEKAADDLDRRAELLADPKTSLKSLHQTYPALRRAFNV